MAEFLQFFFSGLTVGAIYALVALGFTLIYNASDVINFAQGEFVMLGGMTTVFLGLAGVPLPLAALVAVITTVAVGLALHRFAIEPARGASPAPPPCCGREPIRLGGAAILPQSLVVLVGAACVVVLLWLFIDRTLLGKAVIATAANRLAARLVGINTGRIVGLSFAVSAAIGAVAGLLGSAIPPTSYD